MLGEIKRERNANISGNTIKIALNIKSCKRQTKHLILLRTEMPQSHWLLFNYLKRFALPFIYVTNPTNFCRPSLSNLIRNIFAVICLDSQK